MRALIIYDVSHHVEALHDPGDEADVVSVSVDEPRGLLPA